MRLLITGVAGFIGSKIAEAAVSRGYDVIGVDDLSQGHLYNVPKECEFLNFDLVDSKYIDYLPKNIDVILHLAGQSSGEISFDNPIADLEKNAISTLNLINYGIKNKIRKIVHASSMSVYGSTIDIPIKEEYDCAPLSCYGVGKLAAENYLKIYKNILPYISFRMFNVYGPGQDLGNMRQGMVSIYVAQALKNQFINVKGSLNRFRDYIYIDDVVAMWLKSIENDQLNNNVFNLGTGVKTTVVQLLNYIKNNIHTVNWKEIENTPGDQFGIYADIGKMSQYFEYKSFVPIVEGLKKFIVWAEKFNK